MQRIIHQSAGHTDTPIAAVIIRTIAAMRAWLIHGGLEAAPAAVTDRMSLACIPTRFAGSAVTNVRQGPTADKSVAGYLNFWSLAICRQVRSST